MSKHLIILSILPFMLGINVNAGSPSNNTIAQRVDNLENDVQYVKERIDVLTQNQQQQSYQLNNIANSQKQQSLQLDNMQKEQMNLQNAVNSMPGQVNYQSQEEINITQQNATAATNAFINELNKLPSEEAKLRYIQEHGLDNVPGLVDAINDGKKIDAKTIAQVQDNISQQLLSNPSKREEILNNYGVYTNGETPGNIPGVPTQNQCDTNPSINQNITNSSNMEPGLPINQGKEGAYTAGVTPIPTQTPEGMFNKPGYTSEQTQGYSNSGQIYPTQSDGRDYIDKSNVYINQDNNTPVNSLEQMNREILNGLDNINNEKDLFKAADNSKDLTDIITDYKEKHSIQGQLSPEDINNIKQEFANRVINNQNYNDEYPDMTHSQLNLSTSANPDYDRDIRAQILQDKPELANQMTTEERQDFINDGIVPESKQQLKKELYEIQNSYNEQANIETECNNIIEKLQNAPAEQREEIIEKYQKDGILPQMTPDQINNYINTGKLPNNDQFNKQLQNNIANNINNNQIDNNPQYNAPELNELAIEMANLKNEQDRNNFLIQNSNLQNIPGMKEWVQTGTVPDLSHLDTPTNIDQMNNRNDYLPASVNVNDASHPMLPSTETGPQVLDDFNIDYTSLNHDELITKLRRALSDLKTCECNCQILKSQIASQNTPTINQNIPSDIKLDETSNVPTMFNKQPNNILSSQTIVQPSINNSLDDINTNIPTNIATPSSNMNTNVGISNTNIQSGNIVVQESNINQVPVSKELTIEQNNTQNIDAENDEENDEFSTLVNTMDNTTPETQGQPVIDQQKNVIPIGNTIFTQEVNQYVNQNAGEEQGNENIEPNESGNQQMINQSKVLSGQIETIALQNQPIDNNGNIIPSSVNNPELQVNINENEPINSNIPQENPRQEPIIQDTNIDVEHMNSNEQIYTKDPNIMQQQGPTTISTPNEQNSMQVIPSANPNIIIDQNNLNNKDIIAQEQFINEKEPPENQQEIIDPNEEQDYGDENQNEENYKGDNDETEEQNKFNKSGYELDVDDTQNGSFMKENGDTGGEIEEGNDVNPEGEIGDEENLNPEVDPDQAGDAQDMLPENAAIEQENEEEALEQKEQETANDGVEGKEDYENQEGEGFNEEEQGQNVQNMENNELKLNDNEQNTGQEGQEEKDILPEQDNNDIQEEENANIENYNDNKNMNININKNQYESNMPGEGGENYGDNGQFIEEENNMPEEINEINIDYNYGNAQMWGESQEGFDTNNYDDNQLNKQGAEYQEEGDGNDYEENEQSMLDFNSPQNLNKDSVKNINPNNEMNNFDMLSSNEMGDNPNDLNNKALFNLEFAPAIETEPDDNNQIVDNNNNDFLNMDQQEFGNGTDFQYGDQNQDMSGPDINLAYDLDYGMNENAINNAENIQNLEGNDNLFDINDLMDPNRNNDKTSNNNLNMLQNINAASKSNSNGNKILSGFNKGFDMLKNTVNDGINKLGKIGAKINDAQTFTNSSMNKWKK